MHAFPDEQPTRSMAAHSQGTADQPVPVRQHHRLDGVAGASGYDRPPIRAE